MSKLAKALPLLSAVLPALGPVGSVLSAVTSVAGALSGGQKTPAPPPPPAPAQAVPFNPTKPAAIARPGSLDLSGYDPTQERTALATKGINQGLGADEDAYYKNLVSRSLIGDNNQMAADTSTLAPIESQYFSKQGTNTSDISSFLRAIMGTT